MDTQQIIKDRLQVIPEDIRTAIKSVDLAGKFEEIANKHGLHIDQNGNLQTETLLVMIGLEPTKDFVDNIHKELEVSMQEAQSIANDVNDQIFKNIRLSLRKMSEEAGEEYIEIDNNSSSIRIQNPTSVNTTPTPPQPPKPVFNRNPVINTNPVVSNPQTQPAAPVQMPITQKPVETIGSTPLEKAGRFTLENPPIGVPNYTQVPVNKSEALKGIEDLEANMVDHLLSSPVKNTENVEVKKPLIPKPVIDNQPYKADPYREQI